jgi:hypothetical protein
MIRQFGHLPIHRWSLEAISLNLENWFDFPGQFQGYFFILYAVKRQLTSGYHSKNNHYDYTVSGPNEDFSRVQTMRTIRYSIFLHGCGQYPQLDNRPKERDFVAGSEIILCQEPDPKTNHPKGVIERYWLQIIADSSMMHFPVYPVTAHGGALSRSSLTRLNSFVLKDRGKSAPFRYFKVLSVCPI